MDMNNPSHVDIDALFTYHPPNEDQVRRLTVLRENARTLALTIIGSCPAGPDRTAALRKLRECVMTANASIVLEGK